MMNNWQVGTFLNNRRYTIEKNLAKGAFGITYLARDNQINKKVVIKTLNYDELQKRPDFGELKKRFRYEAEQLKKCRHKNIVEFDNSFQEGQMYCIVMEYIDGDNLGVVINKQGILPEQKALNYILQIADALTVVHSQNILHRDIKPENIILRRNTEEVILIDFGLAREFIPNQISLTQCGTHGYAPIEQQNNNMRKHKLGKYTDIYALAATLYFLLTKSPLPNSIDRYHTQLAIHKTSLPKQARSLLKLIFKLTGKQAKYDLLVEPKKINKKISDRLNYAIIKGMEIQPEDRPQTVQEWLALLQLQPQSIMSQMSQVSQKIQSQITATFVPVARPISQNSVKSFYIGEANGLFIVTGILGFVFVVIYIFFPNLNFSINSRPPIDKKIDYTALENFLSSDKFKEADQETLRILLSLVGREKQYWFNLKDIENIPCKDLDKINQLWIYYSNGKFGFSIQKQIWIELGGKPGIYDVTIADIFLKQVGWGEKYKEDIIYKISAPDGHLPFRVTSQVWNFGAPYIAEKLTKCNI
ncbi:MAG: protein kinase [Okeania sp. SIO3C4]|nr:protein kinase [Okeania sp. SIO3C4]